MNKTEEAYLKKTEEAYLERIPFIFSRCYYQVNIFHLKSFDCKEYKMADVC